MIKFLKNLLNFEHTLLFIGIRGSLAHRETTDISDIDLILSYMINPKIYFQLSVPKRIRKGREVKYNNIDIVKYEFKKLIKLASESNPNVLPYLFADESCFIYVHEEFKKFLYLESFLSKKIHITHSGYAKGQLKRMLKPSHGMSENRRKYFETHGYDIKNAAVCCRILQIAIRLFEENIYNPVPYDINTVMDIKAGKFSLAECSKYIEDLLLREQKAFESNTYLPEKPDLNYINELVLKTFERFI